MPQTSAQIVLHESTSCSLYFFPFNYKYYLQLCKDISSSDNLSRAYTLATGSRCLWAISACQYATICNYNDTYTHITVCIVKSNYITYISCIQYKGSIIFPDTCNYLED